MSRIGAQPITLPDGVTLTMVEDVATVVGPKGELTQPIHHSIGVAVADGVVTVSIKKQSKQSAALWGTMRSLLNNMVMGVSEGWEKKLELQGVGYRAALKGSDLELKLGYSHSIDVPAPENITFEVAKEIITVSGIDRKQVGEVAAQIRALRKPEPYKGKGVRYLGEHVRRKVGKVVGATE